MRLLIALLQVWGIITVLFVSWWVLWCMSAWLWYRSKNRHDGEVTQ